MQHGGGGEGCIGVLLRSRNYSSQRRKSCRDFHVVAPLCGLHKSGTTGRVGKLSISLNAAKRGSTPGFSARSAFVRKAKAPSPATWDISDLTTLAFGILC